MLLLLDVSLWAQSKQYKLFNKTINADINQRAILLIDTMKTMQTTRNAFNPVKGKYTVYVFIATFKGLSYRNIEKEFHDIIVLKTDKKQKVLDAYQYTLEWAEMPITSDLYKASAKKVTLTNGLLIEQLKFQKVDPTEGIDSNLNEKGVVIL
jgi:hypothetical protein